MPYLVKKIEGEIFEMIEGNCSFVSNILGEVGVEDYIQINDFIAFTQNFSKVVEVEAIPSLVNYGLKNKTQFLELKLSYPLT